MKAKELPAGFITFAGQFIASEFFKGKNIDKEFEEFMEASGISKEDIENMR